jgi:hypothetical protein
LGGDVSGSGVRGESPRIGHDHTKKETKTLHVVEGLSKTVVVTDRRLEKGQQRGKWNLLLLLLK